VNRLNNPYIFLFMALGSVLISPALCEGIPKTMMKITTRAIQPEPEPGSFSAQARILWRAGTKYARVAEAPDPQKRIHGLMIITEPDVWMINLYDKSGRHMVDKGPSFDVHVPIFQSPAGAKLELDELEFGKELDFFKRNSAKFSAGETINQRPTDRYDVTISGGRLILWTDTESKKPIRVSLVKGIQTLTIEYVSYEDDLPFNRSLFQPPAGISLQDAK
jgi:hypothetical protein